MHYLWGACLSVLQTLSLVVSPRDRPPTPPTEAPQQYYPSGLVKMSPSVLLAFWSWASKQKLTLQCPSALWPWNLGLRRKPPSVSSVLTMMSVLKDSPEEHAADLNAGWVTEDSEKGIPLSQALKSLQFPAISQTSQGWGVWPHVLGEQAHPSRARNTAGAALASRSQHFCCQFCSEFQKCRGCANMSH